MKNDSITDIVMKDRAFIRKLTPYQRDLYSQYMEVIKKKLIKDPEGLEARMDTWREKERRG